VAVLLSRKIFITMSDQAPPTSSPLPSELGKPLETFQPAMENLIAGYILMVLVFIGGALGLFFLIRHVIEVKGDMDFWQARGKHDLPWFLWGLLVLACFGAFLGSFGFWIYVESIRSQRIVLCEEGLCFFMGKISQPVRWDQITCIQELVKREHFPLKGVAKYAVPMGKDRSYVVCRKDCYKASVDADEIRRIGRFGKILKEQAALRGIPWEELPG
jgi:hypothetical protein